MTGQSPLCNAMGIAAFIVCQFVAIYASAQETRTPFAPQNPPAVLPPGKAGGFTPPTKDYAREYVQPFKVSAIPAGWEFDGPDVEDCVRFEPAGLHFILPTGWKGLRPPTGLKSSFGPKGDFEITIGFEILAEPLQADAGNPVGTRVSLGVVTATPHRDTTTLGRVITTNSGRVIIAWSTVWNEEAGKTVPHTGILKVADAKIGRLRLVRSGDDLYYGFSEGADAEFHFFKKYPFGGDDVRQVRLIAGTSTEKASIDARVTDLRIRADAILNMPIEAMTPVAGQAAPQTVTETSWLTVALVVGGALLGLAIVALVAGILMRRRRSVVVAEAPVAFVTFACTACGKKLKAKAQLVGRKIKCSECGMIALVPESKEQGLPNVGQ